MDENAKCVVTPEDIFYVVIFNDDEFSVCHSKVG